MIVDDCNKVLSLPHVSKAVFYRSALGCIKDHWVTAVYFNHVNGIQFYQSFSDKPVLCLATGIVILKSAASFASNAEAL